MALKIINSLEDENKISPVIVQNKLQGKVTAYINFKGELSSSTGIQSKGLYIAKIHELTTDSSYPTLTILHDTYIHINNNVNKKIIGVSGKTWNKLTKAICNPDEQNEEIVKIKEEVKIINKFNSKYG